MLRQKADSNAVFRAEAHQKGTARDVAKADDPADRVNGKPKTYFLLHLDDDRLSLFGKVGALRGDEQGVQVFFHGSPKIRVR